jgi:hypothetical protein
MAFVVGDFICSVMIFVGLIAIIFLLMVPKIGEYRRGEGDRKGLLVVVMVLLIIGLGSYTAWMVADYREWTETRELEYRLNITAPEDAIGVLYVPVSVHEGLQAALEVSPGGAISVVETEYGTALRVAFEGNVSVNGRIKAREKLSDYQLSMVNTAHRPQTHRYWFNFDGNERTNGTVSIELALVHSSIYKYESFSATHDLAEGWTSNKVLWDYQEWYYG